MYSLTEYPPDFASLRTSCAISFGSEILMMARVVFIINLCYFVTICITNIHDANGGVKYSIPRIRWIEDACLVASLLWYWGENLPAPLARLLYPRGRASRQAGLFCGDGNIINFSDLIRSSHSKPHFHLFKKRYCDTKPPTIRYKKNSMGTSNISIHASDFVPLMNATHA